MIRQNIGFLAVFLILFSGFCFFSCEDTPPVVAKLPPPEPVPVPVPVPVIKEPNFSISSITILQAELINTRLKVRVRIDNPNIFPVTLSSFNYELYGEGQYWADGAEKNVFSVPASGFVEKDLFLVMNFIDMKRDILDKVIAMDRVAYRFAGTAEIKAADMPVLVKKFNLEGESEVQR